MQKDEVASFFIFKKEQVKGVKKKGNNVFMCGLASVKSSFIGKYNNIHSKKIPLCKVFGALDTVEQPCEGGRDGWRPGVYNLLKIIRKVPGKWKAIRSSSSPSSSSKYPHIVVELVLYTTKYLSVSHTSPLDDSMIGVENWGHVSLYFVIIINGHYKST